MPTCVFRVRLLPNPALQFDPDDWVYRDVAADGDHTLEAFHEAIFDAFDRYDPHAYEFITHDADGVATRSYVPPEWYEGNPSWPEMASAQIEQFVERNVPNDASEDAREKFRELRREPPEEGNAADTAIDDLDPERLQSLFYEFDFGDGWEHHVELVETHEDSLDGDPVVVDEQGDAPPQHPESYG